MMGKFDRRSALLTIFICVPYTPREPPLCPKLSVGSPGMKGEDPYVKAVFMGFGSKFYKKFF